MKSVIAILNRHPWIYVVLAFALLIGAWSTIITLAAKHGPKPIEVKPEIHTP
jgi:hypothetical protein